jgi:hypothetical protein
LQLICIKSVQVLTLSWRAKELCLPTGSTRCRVADGAYFKIR